MWLFALFVAVPLIEIALFIQVGGAIGLWPTILVVVVTAILGTWLVRMQGARALERLMGSFNALKDPSEPLADGAMILFSGALLLTPGFFTDAVGFALLIPAVRAFVFRWLKSRIQVQGFAAGSRGPGYTRNRDDVIDGDFTDITPNQGRPDRTGLHGPSGWTKPD